MVNCVFFLNPRRPLHHFITISCILGVCCTPEPKSSQDKIDKTSSDLPDGWICREHLDELAVSIALYKGDRESWPSSMQDLYPEYMSDLKNFVCSADSRAGESGNISEWTSYIFEVSNAQGSETAILRCRNSSHAQTNPGLKRFDQTGSAQHVDQ